MQGTHKKYLGDSVYAEFDGYHIILTTDNGYGASNTIALEPSLIKALNKYQQYLIDYFKNKEDEQC